MKRLPLPLWLLFKTNLFKTIIVNFKLLPKKQAIKLPIVLIGKVNIKGCTGKVIFKDPIYTGMAIFGELPEDTCPNKRYCPMRFKIAGKLILEKHVHVRGGGIFNVGRYGTLSIGRDSMINSFSKIWCMGKMSIGQNIRASWETQIFDSNFHYVVDEKGYTKNCLGSVIIGNNVWIGNRCTINKGTVLPDFSIVGSGSFVNKDFTQYGVKALIAGSPAKFIRFGYRRLFNRTKQIEIDHFFQNNPDTDIFYVGNDII